MAWNRILSVVCVAVIGLASGVSIMAMDDAPRSLVAASGVLLSAGLVAAATLVMVVIALIVEEVRPSIRVRKPVTPIFVAHKEASMVGRSRYRMHPIRFWGVFTLNSTFLFGFMVFQKPETIDFKDEVEIP